MRVLSDSELKVIWATLTPPIKIEGATVSVGVAYAVLLAMVTLQRRAEVTGMRLSEIDRYRDLWLLPLDRTKNNREHAVPVSLLALELINLDLSVRSNEGDYIFPSPRGSDKLVNPQALNHTSDAGNSAAVTSRP